MANLLRTPLFLLCVCIIANFTARANTEAAQPKQFQLSRFLQAGLPEFANNPEKIKTFLDLAVNNKEKSVCVCEIMNLKNTNMQVSNVAVFAERTNHGNIGDEYKAAERMIKKEKRQMKQVYFDKIQSQEKLAVATSCLNLYLRLKGYNPDLRVYDILSGD